MKKIIIFPILVLILAAVVMAGELEITSVKIYVNDDKDSSADEDGGKIDNVMPEDTVRFEIRVKNTFSDSENIDIEDIEVTMKILDFDDEGDDDLEFDEDDFDLDPEERNTVIFEFEVPLEIERDIYEVVIEVEGEDENGTSYSLVIDDIELDIEKETHKLKIYELELLSSTVKCGRSTELTVSVINIGKNHEDVDLIISNSDLELLIKDQYTLDREAFKSNNKHSEAYTISIPSGVEAGEYFLDIKVKSPDISWVTEKATLDVECQVQPEPVPQPVPPVTQPEPQQTPQTVTPQQQDTPQTVTTTDTVTQDITVVEKSFLGEYKWPILIGLLYVVVIVIVFFLVMNLVKKKE